MENQNEPARRRSPEHAIWSKMRSKFTGRLTWQCFGSTDIVLVAAAAAIRCLDFFVAVVDITRNSRCR